MAERADQQRRTPASVWIGRATDVPAEPALGLVTEELDENRAASARAKLDATDLVVGSPAMPRRADRDVADAVAVEVAGRDDHPPEQLARLASRPLPELLPGGAGTD